MVQTELQGFVHNADITVAVDVLNPVLLDVAPTAMLTSRYLIPRFVLAPDFDVAPVPPLPTATVPDIFPAATEPAEPVHPPG